MPAYRCCCQYAPIGIWLEPRVGKRRTRHKELIALVATIPARTDTCLGPWPKWWAYLQFPPLSAWLAGASSLTCRNYLLTREKPYVQHCSPLTVLSAYRFSKRRERNSSLVFVSNDGLAGIPIGRQQSGRRDGICIGRLAGRFLRAEGDSSGRKHNQESLDLDLARRSTRD